MSPTVPLAGISIEQVFGACLLAGTGLSLLVLLSGGRGRLRIPLPRGAQLRVPRVRLPFRLPRLKLGRRSGRTAAQLPWTSPFLVSLFLTAFGASGLLLRVSLGVTAVASFWGALGIGSLTSTTLALGAARWLREQDPETGAVLLGIVASVSLAIPAGGVGSIAYHANGRRATMPARCRSGAGLAPGSRVVVLAIEERVASVSEI